MTISVDSARLTDLTVVGWAGLGLSLGSAVYGIYALDALTVIPVLVGLAVAYFDALPEYDVSCDNCGDHVRVHSARDGTDEVVEVNAAGTPRRISVGGLSVVCQTDKQSFHYCSGACATEDESRRHLVGPADLREETGADAPITAADGGELTDKQGTPAPETRDSN